MLQLWTIGFIQFNGQLTRQFFGQHTKQIGKQIAWQFTGPLCLVTWIILPQSMLDCEGMSQRLERVILSLIPAFGSLSGLKCFR